MRDVFKKRLARDNFFGLALTLLILFLLASFVFFGAIINRVLPFEKMLLLDYQFNIFISSARTAGLVNFFLMITALALPQFVAGISIAFTALLCLKKKRVFLMPFLVTFLGGVLTNFLSKLGFYRGRPLGAVYLENTFSFPSGHSTAAVVLYGFMVYYFWKKTSSKIKKNTILVFGLIIILGIGFSRIYLGMHYLSDVVGGYLLGLLWLCLGIGLAEWRLGKRKKLIIG